MVRYIPELESSVYGTCTVRNLLDMAVAIQFEEDYEDPAGDVARYRFSSGWDVPPSGVEPGHQRAYLATLRGTGKPHGKVFHYVSTNTEVLGWVYERACGMPYHRILSDYLWQPLGAEEDGSLTLDSHGMGRLAGGISVTARDLLRFGEMMRNRGVVEGRQVVPGWWIDDIRENGDPKAWADGDLARVLPGRALSQQMVHDRPVAQRADRDRHPRPAPPCRSRLGHCHRQVRDPAQGDGRAARPALVRGLPRYRHTSRSALISGHYHARYRQSQIAGADRDASSARSFDRRGDHRSLHACACGGRFAGELPVPDGAAGRADQAGAGRRRDAAACLRAHARRGDRRGDRAHRRSRPQRDRCPQGDPESRGALWAAVGDARGVLQVRSRGQGRPRLARGDGSARPDRQGHRAGSGRPVLVGFLRFRI